MEGGCEIFPLGGNISMFSSYTIPRKENNEQVCSSTTSPPRTSKKQPRTETQSSDDNCRSKKTIICQYCFISSYSRSDDVEIDIDDFWAKEESDTTRAKKATDFAR